MKIKRTAVELNDKKDSTQLGYTEKPASEENTFLLGIPVRCVLYLLESKVFHQFMAAFILYITGTNK